MSPIPTPQELTIWSEELIADVEFMRKSLYHTCENENAMDWPEMCAVLRYRHQEYCFINPWDVGSIIEWLGTRDVVYGSLKENTKTMIATLGESKIDTWRESIKDDLKIAERKGYKDSEMFEEEDPRRRREQILTP